MRVHYFGFPGAMGGANTECLHTIAVWRRAGIDVRITPTWGAVGGPVAEAVRAMGCEILPITPPPATDKACVDRHFAQQLAAIPDLPGSICMSMCCAPFFAIYGHLKRLGCKVVWSGCMTFEFPATIVAFRQFGLPDAHHFQSRFQCDEITKLLAPLGTAKAFLIRGAFDFQAVPFMPRPHGPKEEFVIGRLSRPEADKTSSNLWPILASVPYEQRNALVMGWSAAQDKKCGLRPTWATCLDPQAIPVNGFLGRCHAMIGLNGGARENWPRVGLEAMAAGVPLVCQNLWGWREMIVHGETGFLCDNDSDFRFYLALLARCEDTRQKIIRQARAHVERIADPIAIGQQWRKLFARLGANIRQSCGPELLNC